MITQSTPEATIRDAAAYYELAGLMVYKWTTLVFDVLVARHSSVNSLVERVRLRVRNVFNESRRKYNEGDVAGAARDMHSAYMMTVAIDRELARLALADPNINATMNSAAVALFLVEYDSKKRLLSRSAVALGYGVDAPGVSQPGNQNSTAAIVALGGAFLLLL